VRNFAPSAARSFSIGRVGRGPLTCKGLARFSFECKYYATRRGGKYAIPARGCPPAGARWAALVRWVNVPGMAQTLLGERAALVATG